MEARTSVTLTNRVYFAGMLDFEGSFEIRYDPHPRPYIQLAQKSRAFLLKVQQIYGGRINQTKLVLSNMVDVENFLADVQPYVKMRKEETILALALVRLALRTEHGKPIPKELLELRNELALQLHAAYQAYKASKTMEVQ